MNSMNSIVSDTPMASILPKKYLTKLRRPLLCGFLLILQTVSSYPISSDICQSESKIVYEVTVSTRQKFRHNHSLFIEMRINPQRQSIPRCPPASYIIDLPSLHLYASHIAVDLHLEQLFLFYTTQDSWCLASISPPSPHYSSRKSHDAFFTHTRNCMHTVI